MMDPEKVSTASSFGASASFDELPILVLDHPRQAPHKCAITAPGEIDVKPFGRPRQEEIHTVL